MGLILPQKVKVDVSGNLSNYYEKLGYIIPRHYDKRHNRYCVNKGTIIDVDVNDLKPNSNLLIECECDICKRKEKIPKIEYTRIKSYIEKYNYDYLCLDCKFDIMPTAKLNVGTFKNDQDKIKDFLIRKLKAFVENNGYPKNKREDFKPKNNMPSLRLYNEYLDGDLVDWLELCGYKLSKEEKYMMRTRGGQDKNLTKDECITIIINMQNKLNRPLQYSDFKHPTNDTIGITYLKKYWGSLNKMKKELGLEIIQESMMDKQLSKDNFDLIINDIIFYLKDDGRNFITTREINENKNWSSYGTLDKICKKYYNSGLIEYLNSFDIIFGKQGNGLNYTFEDSEHTTSQFEYMFSRYLKENGLKYNTDYFRDVKYSTFINGYTGNMNCDYEIHINNHVIYIEIAGIISDYKTWYYENKQISYSKSKEKYRQKLFEKEQMLKTSNLNYYILFPCDLTKDNFYNILFNDSLELKRQIENFHKTNIDWELVRKNGKLDYSKPYTRDGHIKKEAV